MTGGRRWAAARPLLLAAALTVLAGCASSDGSLGRGLGKAVFLLLFVGLVLPATVVGLVAWLVVSSRRRRGRG